MKWNEDWLIKRLIGRIFIVGLDWVSRKQVIVRNWWNDFISQRSDRSKDFCLRGSNSFRVLVKFEILLISLLVLQGINFISQFSTWISPLNCILTNVHSKLLLHRPPHHERIFAGKTRSRLISNELLIHTRFVHDTVITFSCIDTQR